MAVRSKVKTPKLALPAKITLPRKINIIYLLMAIIVVGAFVLGLVLGILITKVQYLEKGALGTTTTTTDTANTGATAPTTPVDVAAGHLPVLGDKNAKVTVIEFADFQCPYCEDFFKNVEANIKKDYVDTGKVKFAFRHYAFLGQESTDAANAAECANDQGKFWEYHDYLYNHQGAENSGAFSKENLKGFAATLGLNTATFNDCLDTNKDQANVDKDLKEGGTAGVNGTPATFVNGILISGAAPYADFKAAIDKALK